MTFSYCMSLWIKASAKWLKSKVKKSLCLLLVECFSAGVCECVHLCVCVCAGPCINILRDSGSNQKRGTMFVMNVKNVCLFKISSWYKNVLIEHISDNNINYLLIPFYLYYLFLSQDFVCFYYVLKYLDLVFLWLTITVFLYNFFDTKKYILIVSKCYNNSLV